MVKLATRENVIFALVRQNGQLNKELIKNANTNHNSLSIELKRLKKEKIIEKHDDGKYWLTGKVDNKFLNSLGSVHTIIKQLYEFIEELEKEDYPVKKAIEELSKIIKLLVMLRLERFASPKLTKRDELEFDLYFDMLDMLMVVLFEILRKKDLQKTEKLKITLMEFMNGK